MEITCADCGCLVDSGVIVVPCENADCCCKHLDPEKARGTSIYLLVDDDEWRQAGAQVSDVADTD